MGEKLTEARWWLSERLFALAYFACPDRAAFTYVMRNGLTLTKQRIDARNRAKESSK